MNSNWFYVERKMAASEESQKNRIRVEIIFKIGIKRKQWLQTFA